MQVSNNTEQPGREAEQTHQIFRSRNFLESLGFALRGLRQIFRSEANFRTQTYLAVLVVAMAWQFQVNTMEWVFLVFCIILMLVLEILNTVVERLCDLHARGQYHAEVKFIKDISAAACLVTAAGSAVIGILIFLPYILKLFGVFVGNIG